jgi:hypothetical protein
VVWPAVSSTHILIPGQKFAFGAPQSMHSPPFGNNRLQQIILKIGKLPTIQKKISYTLLQTFVVMIAKIIAV